MNTLSQIEILLKNALSPQQLLVEDDSTDHIGHANEGAGHYTVHITSDLFEGKSRIARHQMVYGALGDMMKEKIHALRIVAKASSEA